MTVTIGLAEAVKRLPALLSGLKIGDEIILEQGAKPVARILPMEQSESPPESGPNLALFKDLIGSISRRTDGAANHDRYLCEAMKP